MSSASTWQTSATYISSLLEALQKRGLRDAVLAKLDAAVREMAESPHLKSWWPGANLMAVFVAAEAAGGAGTVRHIAVEASRQRMGKLVRPLAGVLLAMAKSPMHALLSRLGTFVSAGLQGVEARFIEEPGKNRGTVTFKFPEPVLPLMADAWFGLFEVGFELAKGGAVVDRATDPTEHRFVVSW